MTSPPHYTCRHCAKTFETKPDLRAHVAWRQTHYNYLRDELSALDEQEPIDN